MQYKWLLFDADGTLYDYYAAEKKAFSNTFVEVEIPYKPEYLDSYRRINRQLWKEFEEGEIDQDSLRTRRFEMLMEENQINTDGIDFAERYLKHLGQCDDLVDGAHEIVEALSKVYKLAIVTNGIPFVQYSRFEKSPIAKRFDKVFVSGEMGVAKPDPEFFNIVFTEIGQLEKKEALVIGDSLTSDIQGANNYGIDACWFNPRNKDRPDKYHIRYEIKRLTELLEILL